MAMIPVALAAVLALAVLVTPLVGAQPAGKTHRVGLLMPSTGGWQPKAFRETLRDLGYTEGVNLILDVRSAEGQLDRLSALAMELVRARPDVIVAVNTPGTRAAIAATTTIPIVMAVVGDPVGSGFVSSLTHPGGNVTGVSSLGGDLAGKRLSLLKQAVPAARRIAVMLPDDPMTALQVRDTERAALSIGIEVRFFPVRTTTELGSVFELMLKWRPDAALWFWGAGRHVGTAHDRAGIEVSPTRHAHREPACPCGWADVLLRRHHRIVPARRLLRRQDPQGHQGR
jgi:putative ABC transport system substrate-binding protein